MSNRNDLLAVADVVHAHQERQRAIHTQRRLDGTSVPVATVDERLKQLAAGVPQAAAAYGLRCAGYPVVALDDTGAPVDEPTRDDEQVLTRWLADPERWPGTPTGPAYDLAAVALNDDGWEWIRQTAAVSRHPDEAPPSWATERPNTYRDIGSTPILVQPPPRPVRTLTGTAFGPGIEKLTEQFMRRPDPQLTWLTWRWPVGWQLPAPGRTKSGVRVLAAVPAEGALLTVAGKQWRVGNFARPVQPMPDWLADALGGKRAAA